MHQDSPYWPIEPMELCSCWFPLDNATLENGCMAVIAGAHRHGALPHIEVRDDYVVDPDHFNPDDMATLPMQAGDGLFFHSLLPHYTAPNRSDTWRRAIALSYMSAQSRYTGEGKARSTTPFRAAPSTAVCADFRATSPTFVIHAVIKLITDPSSMRAVPDVAAGRFIAIPPPCRAPTGRNGLVDPYSPCFLEQAGP